MARGGEGGSPGALPHHHPPSHCGVFSLSGFSVAVTQTLCPLSLSPSLFSLYLGFWLSQCPPAPTYESNLGLPTAPRRTSSH